jgi:hypothetical protein
MIRIGIAAFMAGALAASPCAAAELFDDTASGPPRTGAVAGAYFKLALDGPRHTVPSARSGLRLAMTREVRGPRSFSGSTQANLLDLRLSNGGTGLFVAGRPIKQGDSGRLGVSGESKGRLDKITIGAGIVLAAVAGFFLVSSVAG